MSRTALILCLAFLLPGVPASGADPREGAARLNEAGIVALDAGEYEKAIELFTRARRSLPLDATLAKNLATARSRYGTDLLGKDRLDEAVRQFRFAASLEPASAVHHANLGMALVRAGEVEEGRKRLEKALAIDRNSYPALVELGAIAYRDGELGRAVSYWERAVAQKPGRERVATALERARREYEIEKNHRTLDSPHFSISFDGKRDAGVGDRILTILEDAYERVGADLGIFPEGRCRVILYTGREFQEVTGAHEWVGGLFDGRIRIPVRDFVRAEREIRETIDHEYTHVAVRSVTARCPSWLNEGLAQHYEGRRPAAVAALLSAAKKADRLLGIADLGPSFTRFPDEARARLAYAQALSFTDFLLEGFSPDRVGRYLKAIGEGKSEEEAARGAFYRSLEALFAEWVETL